VSRVGYHCSHEQHAPSSLLEHARNAARTGFTAAMCSDHLMPWLPDDGQGQSGFAWSWLGAAMAATPMSFGTVTAPGDRYHPVITAQAVATLGEMYPARFWVALGTGEAINEHVTGNDWPAKSARCERLRESVDIIRALLRGETVTHEGHVHVRDAKLYTRPAIMPALFGAALTVETARWASGWADGLITISAAPDKLRAVIDAFREGAGSNKPVYVQSVLAYGETEATAEQIAWSWRQAAIDDTEALADIAMPEAFEQRCRTISPAALRASIRISSSASELVDAVATNLAVGADRVYVHHVGTDDERQAAFLEKVAPALLQLP
jgi:probable non-F420 flavinoid oxidoreductase